METLSTYLFYLRIALLLLLLSVVVTVTKYHHFIINNNNQLIKINLFTLVCVFV
jgi:hypothetical protein